MIPNFSGIYGRPGRPPPPLELPMANADVADDKLVPPVMVPSVFKPFHVEPPFTLTSYFKV